MTSPSPLISICIVTYNHQDYIEDCLYSALSQKGDFKLQVLIGDDASSDNTVDIIKRIANKHSKSVRVYSHKKNLGASQNYQFLINKAQGDYIAHLDGDDFWLPGKLKAQILFLKANSICTACYSNAIVITDDKLPWGFFNYPQKKFITLEELISKGNFLNHSSLLYDKKNKKNILAFKNEFIDYQIHLSLAQKGKLGYINQVLVAYRLNSNHSMLKRTPEKVLLLYCQALLSTKNNISSNLFTQGIENFIKSFSMNLIIKKQHKSLIEILNLLRKEENISQFKLIKLVIISFYYEFKNLIKKITRNNIKILQKNSKK